MTVRYKNISQYDNILNIIIKILKSFIKIHRIKFYIKNIMKKFNKGKQYDKKECTYKD